ncbi:MAG TPA: hypothetical protein PK335_14855 [Draconibacterium sp.]|nr:hypothetical protein [Draconibacterium sp.]
MKIQIKYVLCLAMLVFEILPVFSQNESGSINVRFSIPEIAVMDIEPDYNNIEFSVSASADPGGEPALKQISGESVWINYSSAIRKNGNKRSINAQVTDNSLPEGISFYIEASAASPFGSRNQGVSTGKVKITQEPRPIITGIGSCFTGDGVNMGHELRYFVEITDFEKIESKTDQVFTVMYTITDN